MVYSGLIYNLFGITTGAAVVTGSMLLMSIMEDHSAQMRGDAGLAARVQGLAEKIHAVETGLTAVRMDLTERMNAVDNKTHGIESKIQSVHQTVSSICSRDSTGP